MEDDMTDKTFAAALAAAQAKMTNPGRNAANPHFKSRYADLASVRDAVVPALASEGIGIVQRPGFAGGVVSLETVLLYGDAEYPQGTLALPLTGGGNAAHAMGSALTYMRRYALAAIACVAADDDDDGNGAGATRQPTQRQPPRPSGLAEARAALMRATEAAGLAGDAKAEARERVCWDVLGISPADAWQDEAALRRLASAIGGAS
jgi:hypothetical protein